MTSPLPTDEDAREIASTVGMVMAERIPDDGRIPDEMADAIRDEIADLLVGAGFRRSVVSTPSEDDAERKKAIWWAVLEECQGHNGGEPHAVAWGRHGYSQDPTLCDRCTRLIATLQAMSAAVSAPPTITDEALLAAFEEHYLVDDADLFYDRSKLLDGLRAVAALGGEV